MGDSGSEKNHINKSRLKTLSEQTSCPKSHKRIGHHQRNLSLDFRSMGIFLPPLSSTINFEKVHYGNSRSLESVLQKIPEVDIIPSPERERFSSNSQRQISNSLLSDLVVGPSLKNNLLQKEDLTSIGSDDSGVVCKSEITCEMSSRDQSRESLEIESDGIIMEYPEGLWNSVSGGKSSLLRLFESKLFDISMAVMYLFSMKEPGVLCYIGNKLFNFSESHVDFYLPQLINMYLQLPVVADVTHPYLMYRCKRSSDFSLKCVWLLEAYLSDSSLPSNDRGILLKNLILSNDLRVPVKVKLNRQSVSVRCIPEKVDDKDSELSVNNSIASNRVKTHKRAWSDAPTLLSLQKQQSEISARKQCLGNLMSGFGFDNGCTCFNKRLNDSFRKLKICCRCEAPRLSAELQFINVLVNIGKVLQTIKQREDRNKKLASELTKINLNLPARVWLPISSEQPHHIVRIPPHVATVLNSKDKAPYIIYVEVVEVEDVEKCPLVCKVMQPSNILRRSRSADCFDNAGSELEEDSFYSWSQDDSDVFQMGKKRHMDSAVDLLDSYFSNDGDNFTMASDAKLFFSRSYNNARSFAYDPEDPSVAALKEPWDDKVRRVRNSSPFGDLQSWRLLPVIVKTGDDLRQELLASQLINMLQKIWEIEREPLSLHPYRILCLSDDAGLIEPILSTVSLHQIKKTCRLSLREYFLKEYGSSNTEAFLNAQKNFVRSCAAYSILCYLIQVKDRHNGNILLTGDGHVIHIDFGYILSASPRNLGFESSPFKLTSEFVEVMGGFGSDMFEYFKILILRGMLAARKHMDKVISLVEITKLGSQLPCFKSGDGMIQALKNRFHLNLTEQQLQLLVDNLVESSVHSISTKLYDGFQYFTNGIL